MSNQQYMVQQLEKELQRDRERMSLFPAAKQALLGKRRVASGQATPQDCYEASGNWTSITGRTVHRDALADANAIPKLTLNFPILGFMPWLASPEVGQSPPERLFENFVIGSSITHLIRPELGGQSQDGSYTISATAQTVMSDVSADSGEGTAFAHYKRTNLIFVSGSHVVTLRRPLTEQQTNALIAEEADVGTSLLVESLVKASALGKLERREGMMTCNNPNASVSNSHLTDISCVGNSDMRRGFGVLTSTVRRGLNTRAYVRADLHLSTVDVRRMPRTALAVKAMQQLYPEITQLWDDAGVWYERGVVGGRYSESMFVEAIAELLNTVHMTAVLSSLMQAAIAYNRVNPMSDEGLHESQVRVLHYLKRDAVYMAVIEPGNAYFTARDVCELIVAAVLTTDTTLTRLMNLTCMQKTATEYDFAAHLKNLCAESVKMKRHTGRAELDGYPLDLGLAITSVRNLPREQQHGFHEGNFRLLPVTVPYDVPADKFVKKFVATRDIFESSDLKLTAMRELIGAAHSDVGAATSDASSERSEFERGDDGLLLLKMTDALLPRATAGMLVSSIHWADTLSLYDAGCVSEATIGPEYITGPMSDLVSMSTALKLAKFEIPWSRGFKLGVNSSKHEYAFYTRDKRPIKKTLYESSDKVTLRDGRRDAHTAISLMIANAEANKVESQVRVTTVLCKLTMTGGARQGLRSPNQDVYEGQGYMLGGMLVEPEPSGNWEDRPVVIKSRARFAPARMRGGLTTHVSKRALQHWRDTRGYTVTTEIVWWPSEFAITGRTLVKSINKARSLGFAVKADAYSILAGLLTGLDMVDEDLTRSVGVRHRLFPHSAAYAALSPMRAGKIGHMTRWYGAVGFMAMCLKIAVWRAVRCNYGNVRPQVWGYMVHATAMFSQFVPPSDCWVALMGLAAALDVDQAAMNCAALVTASATCREISAANNTEQGCDERMNWLMTTVNEAQTIRATTTTARCAHVVKCEFTAATQAAHTCILCRQTVGCAWCRGAATLVQNAPAFAQEQSDDITGWQAEDDIIVELDPEFLLTPAEDEDWTNDMTVFIGWSDSRPSERARKAHRTSEATEHYAELTRRDLIRSMDIIDMENIARAESPSLDPIGDERLPTPRSRMSSVNLSVADLPIELLSSAGKEALQIVINDVMGTVEAPVTAVHTPEVVPVEEVAPPEATIVKKKVLHTISDKFCCLLCKSVDGLPADEKIVVETLRLHQVAKEGSIAEWVNQQGSNKIDWKPTHTDLANLSLLDKTTQSRWSFLCFIINGLINLQRQGYVNFSAHALNSYNMMPAAALWRNAVPVDHGMFTYGEPLDVTAGIDSIDGYFSYAHMTACDCNEDLLNPFKRKYPWTWITKTRGISYPRHPRVATAKVTVIDGRLEQVRNRRPYVMPVRSVKYIMMTWPFSAKKDVWYMYDGRAISAPAHVIVKWNSDNTMEVVVAHVCDDTPPQLQQGLVALWDACRAHGV